MIRYKPTRITLGDGDLRYHLQRLLNRHSRLAEWHQHDQFLNDSSFDDGEDNAFLESDSDLFSAPSVSPPDSVCYSAPDEALEDGSSLRGRGGGGGGGDHNTRTECPPGASASPSSTKDTGSPVIVQPSALSLETARSAGKNVDVHGECRLSMEGQDTSLGGRNGEANRYSPGCYDSPVSSLSGCLTPPTAVPNSVRGDVTGETHFPRPCSQTPVSFDSCSLNHRSGSFSTTSLPEPLDTRAVILTNLLTNLLLEKQPTQQSVDLNRTHTNLDAADEERGTKSDIENHPRSLVTIQPGRSTKPISPSLTDREEFRSTSITDTMVDGGKTKLRSSKRPTRGQRASNLLGDAVPSCDSCALGAHNPTSLDEKATFVTESQHDPRSHSRSTKARLHGCPVDNGGPENTQRPTKLVKLKGINLAVIDKLSPSAQTDIGQSLRVPDRAPGTGSCQGYGDPPKTIAGKDEFRQENQPPRSAFATPTALAQSLALSGNGKSHTLMQPMSARMSATQAHPCEEEEDVRIPALRRALRRPLMGFPIGQHREAALHSIEVEAANFETYVNMAMYQMLASSESEDFKDMVE